MSSNDIIQLIIFCIVFLLIIGGIIAFVVYDQKRINKKIEQRKERGESNNMIKCPACGKEISIEADSCPNCGKPINKKINMAGIIIGIIILIIGFSLMLGVEIKIPVSINGSGTIQVM